MAEFYFHFKFVHLLSAVVFLGNLIVSAMWKLQADRTGQPAVAAFAARLVARTDKIFTAPAAFLVLMTGGMLPTAGGYGFGGQGWIHAGATAFVVSGLIWLIVLIPIQRKQLAMAEAFGESSEIPADYQALTKRWAKWGGIATLLPIVALALMVYRPWISAG
ncbi:MAG: hypothetical protein CMJ94_13260 [Planctomycetes bacterium]|nr:hypothetical protein [Planctomycetota bacterium]